MAVKAARERGRKERGITSPNVVRPTSAHAAFEKGCYYFGLESRRIAVRDDWRADAPADGIPAARRSRGWRFMLASEAELGHARRVLLDGDEAFARVRGYLCDAAAIGACYREHVGPPSKPLKSQIRDLQRALGRAEVPGVPDELARLLAEEKEEGADEGARKVKEDWGDVDEEAW